ncbi:MAG: DNA double-strand break repair nuclease NurA [Chloroflexi bacterium]|nr:DNA double-strand break repair nuclease NurA [Chloroflexota bacterium]
MALDFQQVRKQVIEMGENAPLRAQYLREKRDEALEILEEYAAEIEALQAKVDAAISANPNLRCAMPKDENLNHRQPCPPLPEKVTLLAADGSQINPDRHASVDYCLVNVGAIKMRHGEPDSPITTVRSQLLYDEQMYTAGGRITERMVALMRDLRERVLLADLAKDVQPPIITLTDGPLELWVGREGALEAREYEKRFKEYLGALRELHSIGVSTAGYIDRPRGDLLVRLLEIATLPNDELDKAGREYRPYRGIADADLFYLLLEPGERSAVFGIQSRNADKYTAELALHFFYLNVGRDEKHPYPVRVEIPAWVADNPQKLNDLHAILVQQCQVLGSRTYPYLLHRSHEVAVVTQDEKRQVENMIALELRRRGVEVSGESQKQGTKADSGQTGRY